MGLREDCVPSPSLSLWLLLSKWARNWSTCAIRKDFSRKPGSVWGIASCNGGGAEFCSSLAFLACRPSSSYHICSIFVEYSSTALAAFALSSCCWSSGKSVEIASSEIAPFSQHWGLRSPDTHVGQDCRLLQYFVHIDDKVSLPHEIIHEMIFSDVTSLCISYGSSLISK